MGPVSLGRGSIPTRGRDSYRRMPRVAAVMQIQFACLLGLSTGSDIHAYSGSDVIDGTTLEEWSDLPGMLEVLAKERLNERKMPLQH